MGSSETRTRRRRWTIEPGDDIRIRAEDEDALADERALLGSRRVPGIAGVGAGGVIVTRRDDRPRLFDRDREVPVGGRGTAHSGPCQPGEDVEVEEFTGGG